MVKKREEWPEIGEFVIVTVREILPHGVYVTLDEYGEKQGYIHIGELSTTWVKNIRDFVRENQKTVTKVSRIDKLKGHIDLSLKRATEQAKKRKVFEWKRAQKAENLLSIAAQKIGKTVEQAYEEAGWKIEDAFGEIYQGFEKVIEEGEDALLKIGISEDWVKAIKSCAESYIQVRKVMVDRIIELKCFKPNGVEAIKNSLLKAVSETESDEIAVNVTLVGTPRYRFTVTAKDYKTAEKEIDKAVKSALDDIKMNGGEGSTVKA